MVLTDADLTHIAEGEKITRPAIQGKKKGKNLTIDRLGGKCAEFCKAHPQRITVSECYSQVKKDEAENVSRGMVKGRLDKLWQIGFLQATKEPKGDGQTRTVYSLEGESPPLSPSAIGDATPRNHPYFEPAPSGRSSCRTCGELIPKKQIRLVVPSWEDVGGRLVLKKGYHHRGCYLEGHAGKLEDIIRVTLEKKLLTRTETERIRQEFA